MRRLIIGGVVVVLALGVVGGVAARGDTNRNAFKAQLSGYNEVPSISTTGSGDLRLSVNPTGTEISFTLRYSSLQGGAAAAAHIHLGQPGVSGGVIAFLCGGGSKPACPAAPATVTGTIVASDIVGPTGQGLAAGDLAAALRAIRSGFTYANVHTPTFPGGEIRGQLRAHGNSGG